MRRKWIKAAIKKKGALRKTAKVKKGKKISGSELRRLAKEEGKTGKRARLALILRRLRSR